MYFVFCSTFPLESERFALLKLHFVCQKLILDIFLKYVVLGSRVHVSSWRKVFVVIVNLLVCGSERSVFDWLSVAAEIRETAFNKC